MAEIIHREIEEEMTQSYIDYAMSVIIGRALPDAKDGLKPVHRRILYSMHEIGLTHNKAFKKCARIVGQVLGAYHPHGDSAVYDALVRMAQDFSLRYPLILGQGNFGSIDGDSAAAYRYTEAKLNKFAESLLEDIEKDTVEFRDNFDGSLKEPSILPAKIPNLLVNGSSGIAVGMATNIPPHNIKEICRGIFAVIKDPEISNKELIEYIPGPDFPTGGIIKGREGIIEAYTKGRGRITVRGRIDEEDDRLIIKEIPYMVNKSQLIEQIADLVKEKKIEGIKDIRDESSNEGMRVVVELKKGFDASLVINRLYKYSRLSVTSGIIFLALVDNMPKVLTLRGMIEQYILHRKEVIRRRTQFELDKAEKRVHILRGLITALENIDPIIKGIKKSRNTEEARRFLTEEYSLSEIQSKAILEMKLQKLSSLERENIRNEHSLLTKNISEFEDILAKEEKVILIIKKDLEDIMDRYGDERRTEIEEGEGDIEYEELIEDKEVAVTITHQGYVKRTPLDLYRTQKRGGKGVIAVGKREEDFVKDIFTTSNLSYLLIFTNKGRIYWLKTYFIPAALRNAKGKPLRSLIKMQEDETVMTVMPIKEFSRDKYIIFITKKGTIKKTKLFAFSRPRMGGIIAINLHEGDELISTRIVDKGKQIVIATHKGYLVRFDEGALRELGRNSMGVRGIRLRENDYVVGADVVNENTSLLTITERGYGKRTAISKYRITSRGSKGVINIKVSAAGDVISTMPIQDSDELILISKNGITIRMHAKDISEIGRATKGVRLMRLAEDDKLVSAARVINENESTDNYDKGL